LINLFPAEHGHGRPRLYRYFISGAILGFVLGFILALAAANL
jgi:hypothetical protein